MQSWLPALWFLLILALIPAALWLLKRSPLPVMQQRGARIVGSTHLGPGQRLITVEVGEGEQRRWLLLGATSQGISKLHELEPGPEAPPPSTPRFADLLKRSS